MKDGEGNDEGFKLDVIVAASGFGNKEQQILSEVCMFFITKHHFLMEL